MNNNSKNKEKIVYTAMCCDYFHYGHLRIIQQSSKLGKVIVGVLTDKAIASYKRMPMLPYEKRKKVVENIKGIWKVVPQNTLSYKKNLLHYRPDIVTNGDDWREGPLKQTRQEVIDILKELGGQLIEFSYTKEISSTKIIEHVMEKIFLDEQFWLSRNSTISYFEELLNKSHLKLKLHEIEEFRRYINELKKEESMLRDTILRIVENINNLGNSNDKLN